MDLTLESAKGLAQQLQDAHRYAAGFYQRFIPMMNEAVSSRGFKPESWYSARFDKPPFRRPSPEGVWAWDFLPMCYTRFRFVKRELDEQQNEKNTVLEITFIPDPGLKESVQSGYPDPVAMNNSDNPEIVITAWAVDSTRTTETDVDELWKKSSKKEFTKDKELPITRYDSGLLKSRVVLPLADFILKPEDEIKKVLRYLSNSN